MNQLTSISVYECCDSQGPTDSIEELPPRPIFAKQEGRSFTKFATSFPTQQLTEMSVFFNAVW